MKPTRERQVVCYDREGNFISEFISLAEAARFTNSKVGKIVLCCQLKLPSHNDMQWRYIEDKQDQLSPLMDNHRIAKRIAQLNENGEIIATYDSMMQAAKAVNGTQSAISRVISGKKQTHTHKGWGWKIVDEIVQ